MFESDDLDCTPRQYVGCIVAGLAALHAGGKETKIPARMDLLMSLNDRVNLRLKFTSTLPSELQESCVNKAFQLIRQTDHLNSRREQVAVFDEAKQEWDVCTDMEFIQKMVQKDRANKPSPIAGKPGSG
jgi:hypothetical protein